MNLSAETMVLAQTTRKNPAPPQLNGIRGKLNKVLLSPQGIEISKRNKRVTTQYKGGNKVERPKPSSQVETLSKLENTPLGVQTRIKLPWPEAK